MEQSKSELVPQGAASQKALLEFRDMATDLANGLLFALERRHLDYLRLDTMPASTGVAELNTEDLFFLQFDQIGHGLSLERSLDVLNMQNILGSLRDGTHNVISALCSHSQQAHLYLGARHVSGSVETADFVSNMGHTIQGNLPGTRFTGNGETGELLHGFNSHAAECIRVALKSYPHMAALTGIPSLKAQHDQQFAQSLDRFIQALQGQHYLLLMIAEPVQEPVINDVMTRALQLSSEVHSLVRVGASFSQSIATAVASGINEGTIKNEAEAKAVAENTGAAVMKSPGAAIGGMVGSLMGLALSPIFGPASLGLGVLASSMAAGILGGTSAQKGTAHTNSRTRTWGESITRSLTETSSRTETASMNVEYLNKTAEYCTQVIEGYIRRLQQGKNLGMWNVGVYFLAEQDSTFAQGRAQLRSLYSGQHSHLEPLRTIHIKSNGARQNMARILASFQNPLLGLYALENHEPLDHPFGPLYTGMSTLLNTEEFAVLQNPPRREVPGLKMNMVADFGLNPAQRDSVHSIGIGSVIDGGTPLEGIPVQIDPVDLTRHIFISGITGSGKTNTSFALLLELNRRGVPFLVLEPAKGDYRRLKAQVPDLQVFTPGDSGISLFRINPFQFVPGVNLVTHLDYLKSIFNASFPMYAAMPYLLEEALIEIYKDKGWNLETTTHRTVDMPGLITRWQEGKPDYSYTDWLPNLDDLLAKIDAVVLSKGYAQEITQNYAAALKARINSLKLGGKGAMLNVRAGISYEDLFERPTVLEMRAMGDDDEKCFVMALLLTQLYEYRDQQQRYRENHEPKLRHVTVFEEAHRLLSRAGAASLEVANPRGKAVETFANMLAEIREYGEGILIIDQSPSKLAPEVLRNTSMKIVHRLTAQEDCTAVADAMNMNLEQRQMLPLLDIGSAILHAQSENKPMWVAIPQVKDDLPRVTDANLRREMLPAQWQMSMSALNGSMRRVSERLQASRTAPIQ